MNRFERLADQSRRLLLGHLDDPVAVLSPRGRVAYVNPALTRAFGVDARAAIGKPLDQTLPEWMARAVLQQSAEMQALPRARSFWLRGPVERFRASLAPIVLDGRYLGAMLSLWDASQEVANKRQNLELFRFMLNDLGSKTATDETTGPDPVRDGLQRLRDFTEVFFGEVHPEPAPFHPDRLVALTLRSMRLLAESRKVTVEDGMARELPRMRGDAGLLSRVLALLAEYMIRRAPSGNMVVLSAELLRGTRDRLAYSVTGLGMVEPASWLSQKRDVPADYATLTDEQKNHGLRLIMAKRLVQGMDGRIDIAAHESVGTTICAQIPVEVIEEQ